MKTFLFLGIVLISGFSAGIIQGVVNLVVTEPYMDKAINIENQKLFASGQAQDTPQFWEEFKTYRMWQKEGGVVTSGILGLGLGALFGLLFAYSRHLLPGQNHVKKSLVLGGIMWFTIFFVPFLKYPANPPSVGEPETILSRTLMYVVFVALSGLGALAFSWIYKKLQKDKRRFAIPVVYAIYITIAFILMPSNPDTITAPANLLNGFRTASASTVTLFWLMDAIILGFLWQKFQPHTPRQQEIG